jgi:steroid Delta-isomerase
MDRPAATLLYRHVERFNAGVRSGDFSPMLEGFADEADLVFEGVPVGPFEGRAAIAAAYAAQPPIDEIVILEAMTRPDGLIVADYAWLRTAERRAGEMRITRSAGRIVELVVTFE